MRLVVATHHNLAEDVEKGTFRRDLLYRIKVARLHLSRCVTGRRYSSAGPCLSGAVSSGHGKVGASNRPEALQVLTAYPWPECAGTESAVESALIHCKGRSCSWGISRRRSGIPSRSRPMSPLSA
ncbi:MAG: sigma 54-interacting transcriptional regulator [Nitrospira sp.]|nr:sigma 54-interacting transcriptional regulator [Nitrospira sp.]